MRPTHRGEVDFGYDAVRVMPTFAGVPVISAYVAGSCGTGGFLVLGLRRVYRGCTLNHRSTELLGFRVEVSVGIRAWGVVCSEVVLIETRGH